MKKIIVPIDFSPHSEYALKTAAKLARRNDADLLALHMLELSDAVLIKSDAEHQQKAIFYLELAKRKFEEFLQKDYLQGVNVVPLIKHYKVFSEVNDVAIDHSADLIVMGSHGASGFKEFFIGSNTERVVRHSEIPVLVVKNEANIDFETVVFVSNFEVENVKPYKKAKAMFEAMNSTMKLLYVNLPNEHFKSSTEVEAKIAEFLNAADGNLDNINNVAYQADYSVEQGVINFANKIGADLIVVPTHGRTGIAHFFGGSIGEDIANHANLPVMTFKID